MYAETYPDLKKKYDVDNFEQIAEALDKHFGDLFKLDALNSDAKKSESSTAPEGSYAKLFRLCMAKLQGLHTVSEVIAKLYDLLHDDESEVKQHLITHFIFVPPVGHTPSKQIGALEKMATDSHKMAEPATFIDMMRVLNGIKKRRIRLGKSDTTISVIHLGSLNGFRIPDELPLLEKTVRKLVSSNQVLIVNFNLDIKGMPKWGVVNLSNTPIQVYCETSLAESEKAMLEDKLGNKGGYEYLDARASGTQSTGYSAIAWLDENITKVWNFDTKADFASLVRDYFLLYFSLDVTSLTYKLVGHEIDKFCTADFRHIASRTFPDFSDISGIETQSFQGGRSVLFLTSAAILGQLGGQSFVPGNIGEVIRIVGRNKWTHADLMPSFYRAWGTAPPGFASTMASSGTFISAAGSTPALDLRSYPKYITESDGDKAISLVVPDTINFESLIMSHILTCTATQTNSNWLRSLQESHIPRAGGNEAYAAATMVKTLVRMKSKKSILNIHLPLKYTLNAEEITFIVSVLKENAYVTKFVINENPSLRAISQQLTPTFARNRWLEAKGYRPPMFDDYWKQAAKYWLLHLNNEPDILLPKTEHQDFKVCVAEMGIRGLEAVLDFLTSETDREVIERVYGRHQPPFYAACPIGEIRPYLTRLIKHLREESYFPFNELGIAYQPGNDGAFIDLLVEINKLGAITKPGEVSQRQRFEKVTLTDCLPNQAAFKVFLTQLIRSAAANKWVGLIVIPELENKDNVSEELRVLRVMYAQLNNVILHNRHMEAARVSLKAIKEASDFTDVALPTADADAAPRAADAVDAVPIADLARTAHTAIGRLEATAAWPLKRGGAVQLQLQQQQQIQQQRQVQQQQQKVRAQVLEEAIAEPLVDYTNIEASLRGYLDKFALENPVYPRCAFLKTDDETLLQGFFHTWVNANPRVRARQVIQKMTVDAAKMLLRKHRVLASGLNPDNLPKGFYTQRSKDGDLILCYNAELGYVSPPTAFTINLDGKIPEAEAWEGDFRQFAHETYTDIAALTPIDWQRIVLFAMMQPVKADYSADFVKFCDQNSTIVDLPLFRVNQEKIKQHWVVFLQVWQYAGVDGVTAFLNRDPLMLKMSPAIALELLLSKQPTALQAWARARFQATEESLRALGQIYYRSADEGVGLFLAKLRQIDTRLGADFFNHLSTYVLALSKNYNCFMSEAFFMAMDDMITKLSPADAGGTKSAWKAIIAKHMYGTGWENLEKLWQGFDYFIAELSNMGLKLEGDEFNDIPLGNMLIAMDRILESLKHIPTLEKQQVFLKNLKAMDLTHGGVHYALQHEKFKFFDRSLELYKFVRNETYAPDITRLYDWTSDVAPVRMKRALASKARFTHEAYTILSREDVLGNANETSKDKLMWLLHTQYPSADMEAIVAKLDHDPRFTAFVARHLHHIVYRLGHQHLVIQLDAMIALQAFLATHPSIDISKLMHDHSHGIVLEAVTILHQLGRWTPASAEKLMKLFTEVLPKGTDCPDYFYREAYKLATLFGAEDKESLEAFLSATKGMLPVVQNELRLLITQLLSIDYHPADNQLSALNKPANWAAFLACIQAMKDKPAATAEHRLHLMKHLTDQGLVFKYFSHGEFRALTDSEDDTPNNLDFFVDHQDRLLAFIRKHIAVPIAADPAKGEVKEALDPIIRFFKILQLNRTYLNEIEPLLASLETTKPGLYWSSTYFYGLLRALQPDNDKASFPISLLKVMLKETLIGARTIESLEKEFPHALADSLQLILKNTLFTRVEQSLLCQIALREFNWQGSSELLNKIMGVLASDRYKEGREYGLVILSKCKNFAELQQQFNNCSWLLAPQSTDVVITAHWNKTAALWLKALSNGEREQTLFASIQANAALSSDPEKQALILHIIAWSSLSKGLRDAETYRHELSKKAPKIVERLSTMDKADLYLLAQCYPAQPSPTADDILRLHAKLVSSVATELEAVSAGAPSISSSKKWENLLDEFMHKPYPEPRSDYGTVALTRDTDLQRMIAETQVSRGTERTTISALQAAKLTLIFSYLKQLESGEIKISGCEKPIASMNQEELAAAFKRLSLQSKAHGDDDLLRAQIWAVLFEVLGRTTRKYPHLAQQFALIANDICIDSYSRVLQLATGEGKSHFVALRAARHAALGKTVDICTAKRTLATRDLEDYKALFDYLGLTTAYIAPKSSRESYTNSQIHYSTTGDLSLFLDHQSYIGTPIEVDPANRVALFDEFDFIRDDEGSKTQYNYARPTGKTPKQMTWFYQVVNDFYRTNKASGFINVTAARPITRDVLNAFIDRLIVVAGDNEERQILIKSLLSDPIQLVQWLQSAHEAHELVWDIGFTVREEYIEVGEETYPMREVIPLSSDNQPMIGSTFSAGVHQLLAVRLNTEAKEARDESGLPKEQPQNFHIHPESHIISSQVAAQRMRTLWGSWEGFSGTISAAQAAGLHTTEGTEVLHVPTNQNDLRRWHDPLFYTTTVAKTSKEQRLNAIVKQIRLCLENKQSILFSCKNDKQVKELQEDLSKKLTPEELKQFIFFTNAEERTSSDVLDDKTAKEDWHGGKKRQGVVLVASGFGRGDNVGVEAVFLIDVNDTNDMMQKGGRTARNGEAGEVFRFFLTEELAAEYTYLRSVLGASPDVDMGSIDGELAKIETTDENRKTFEKVMLLREYVFNLQNAANQGYHNAIAQLSAWGMNLLGAVSDPTLRNTSMLEFSSRLKRLEKKWVTISSNAALSVDQKITAIEDAIREEALEYSRVYASALGTREDAVTPFNLEHQLIVMQLVVPKKIVPTPRDRAIAFACSTLARLTDVHTNPRSQLIPDLLAVLAGDKRLEGLPDDGSGLLPHNATADAIAFRVARLKLFVEDTKKCTSVTDFLNKLEIAVEQVRNPVMDDIVSPRAQAMAPVTPTHLFSSSERVEYDNAMRALLPELQKPMSDALCESGLRAPEDRIRQAMPLIQYLGRCSPDQQRAWGMGFILNMEQLFSETPGDSLKLRLESTKPMSFGQANAIWYLAKTYSLNDEQTAKLLTLLSDVIGPAPEQRLRLLTKWESWVSGLKIDQSASFLLDFCKVMQGFTEGQDWDVFIRLNQKTHDWWNKGGERKYQETLLSLWQQIAKQRVTLPADLQPLFNEFIKRFLDRAGKEWFEILLRSFKGPMPILLTHPEQIGALWEALTKKEGKKSEKLDRFSQSLKLLETFYELINTFTAQNQSQLLSKLWRLKGERLLTMLDLVGKEATLLKAQPGVLDAILEYLNEERSEEQTARIVEALLHIARYREANPASRVEHLLEGLKKYKDDEDGLSILLELYAKNPKHIEAPLFDGVVGYLRKQKDASIREQIVSIVDIVYGAASEKREASTIMKSRVAEFFDFTASAQRRIAYMHMLHEGIFITPRHHMFKEKDYKWSTTLNNMLLKLGFKKYTDETHRVLEQHTQKQAGRDLTVSQQHKLLNLTDELSLIGQPIALPGDDEAGKAKRLGDDISQLLSSYRGRWFKSASREKQAEQLNKSLTHIYANDGAKMPKYEDLLDTIERARKKAIEDDFKENASRRYFQMNRSGKSRYLETLNKMHDMVLRHWTNDAEALQRFQTYQETCQEEFLALLPGLLNTVAQEKAKLDFNMQIISGAIKMKSLQRFFGPSLADIARLDDIIKVLTPLTESQKEALTKAELDEVMKLLRDKVAHLPGHIVTLVNEVLIRGDALTLYLAQHDQNLKEGGTLRGGSAV